MPTKQETFDTVARHLLTQGEKSEIDGVGCAYFGQEGRRCAAGVLIPEDKYDPEFEGEQLYHGASGQPENEASKVIYEAGHDLSLCQDLQFVHDSEDVCNWIRMLGSLAENWDLSTAVLAEF
jgi:hypothetical protein